MRILLLSLYRDSHYNVPPISLGYVAKGLIMDGFDVKILDSSKNDFDYPGLKKEISAYSPDIIGIQVYSCNAGMIREYSEKIRNDFPDVKIVLGGPHVSGVKSEILNEFRNIDYAFQGEADNAFPMLIKCIKEGKKELNAIPGLVWNENSKIKINAPEFAEDLDKIGMPSWELMDPNDYKGAPQGAVFRNFPIAPILTSRGCPYSCTFCANHIIHGRKVRTRSIPNVLDEIEYLQKQYGVKEIHIIDDNFASSKERVLEFCKGVEERGLKFTLTFPNGIRLNCLDEDVLAALKKAGCYAVIVGIESGSQKILNDMKKSLTLSLIEKKVELINKFGIDATGFFIIGFPTETEETIKETIEFAKKLKLKRAHFSLFLPLPGTEMTEKLIKEGKLKNVDWSRLSYTNATITPEGITPEELKKWQRKAFHEFYFRPKIIWAMIKEVNSPAQLKMLLKRAMDYGFKRSS